MPLKLRKTQWLQERTLFRFPRNPLAAFRAGGDHLRATLNWKQNNIKTPITLLSFRGVTAPEAWLDRESVGVTAECMHVSMYEMQLPLHSCVHVERVGW